jgi:hypothetical protein
MRSWFIAVPALLLAGSSSVLAAPLYSENFDSDVTANWTFKSSITGDTAANNAGGEANFFFDYSTAGIPSAPHSAGGTTIGLKMEANVPGTGVFSGMSASPNNVHITGDFTMTFDAWQNMNGPMPGGGNGSTQVTMGGFGSTGNNVIFPGTGAWKSVAFGATGDGGSGVDYRAYLGNTGFTGTAPVLNVSAGATLPDAQKSPAGVPVWAAGAVSGSTNNSNAYYTAAFAGHPAPADQITKFSQQTGNTAAGALALAWHSWEIQRAGNILTWKVDGTLIATIDTTMNPNFAFDGDNIFFGQFDINATSSTDANARNLLFGLIDNVVVTPEPGTLAFLALGGLAVLRRRH